MVAMPFLAVVTTYLYHDLKVSEVLDARPTLRRTCSRRRSRRQRGRSLALQPVVADEVDGHDDDRGEKRPDPPGGRVAVAARVGVMEDAHRDQGGERNADGELEEAHVL